MPVNIYETDKLLAEYLLFHYGSADEILPYEFGPGGALDFAVRCVSAGLETFKLPAGARALDLGCAVGRSSFELARRCSSVVGIDFSHRFIEAAQRLRDHGQLSYSRLDEGALCTELIAHVPAEIDRSRVTFEPGDAMNLRPDLGEFDVVLMANLIDRLSEPSRCLERLASLVKPGGRLVITSPYTWLEEFTPRENWLGGQESEGGAITTLQGLTRSLEPNFIFEGATDLPFLIREHSRKFQWSVAQATFWSRR
ncbi:MAG: Methyltransferase type 11 [Chthoniobacteraceae bacterium]|nr:Methyltransferase type 11 [Chthoniobacteraceae bacterium]